MRQSCFGSATDDLPISTTAVDRRDRVFMTRSCADLSRMWRRKSVNSADGPASVIDSRPTGVSDVRCRLHSRRSIMVRIAAVSVFVVLVGTQAVGQQRAGETQRVPQVENDSVKVWK